MKLKLIQYIIIAFIALSPTSCIEDGFTSSPSHVLSFSTDTLNIGDVYTDELTVTNRMTIYNRHDKSLNISDISISGQNAQHFRINVDGLSGREFNDIEIRANDSIFVFAEAWLPENDSPEPQTIMADMVFHTNGVEQIVKLSATGQDIVRMNGVTIDRDSVLACTKPYRVTDSLVVAQNCTLTIEPGARLLFHDKARLIVHGTLIVNGAPGNITVLTGDRTGNVLPDVSFDIMSRQWDGIEFSPSSHDNVIQFAEISNTCYGLTVYGDGSDIDQSKLVLINSRLHNSGECVLEAINASVEARGCEFAEAAYALTYLLGGNHRFDQCTFANNYLFSAISGAAIMIIDPAETQEYADAQPIQALFTNSIIYGLGADVNPGDLTGYNVQFQKCLFGSEGSDDDNFINSMWGVDPLYYTVRQEYKFDYRLQPESPAIGAADISLSETLLDVDYYGIARNKDLGAYAFDPTLADNQNSTEQ